MPLKEIKCNCHASKKEESRIRKNPECGKEEEKKKKTNHRIKTTIKDADFNPKYLSNYIKLNWTETSQLKDKLSKWG